MNKDYSNEEYYAESDYHYRWYFRVFIIGCKSFQSAYGGVGDSRHEKGKEEGLGERLRGGKPHLVERHKAAEKVAKPQDTEKTKGDYFDIVQGIFHVLIIAEVIV